MKALPAGWLCQCIPTDEMFDIDAAYDGHWRKTRFELGCNPHEINHISSSSLMLHGSIIEDDRSSHAQIKDVSIS